MEKALLDQIWPIFSAEAREHLQVISSGVLELEQDPTRTAVLEGIRRTAHSLKGSAGSLGLGALERLAHAIEGSLAGFDPARGIARATVLAALDAVRAIEDAVVAGDAGGEVDVPRLPELLSALEATPPAGGGPGPDGPQGRGGGSPPVSSQGEPPRAESALGLVEQLEEACTALVRPLEDAERHARAGAAVALARRLAREVDDSPLPERLAAGLEVVGRGGPEGARAAAGIAGDLVELRALLERGRPSPAPAPAAQPAAAPTAPADRSIRVLASTMDSLTRQIELLSLGESRHRRRAAQVHEAELALREAVRGLEQLGRALRAEQVEQAREELGPATERLRALAVRLARLAREGAHEADGQRLTGVLLREDLRALRMVPASLALEPLRRVVREVAGRTGKEVELTLAGAEVRLDRRIVDELRDPLLHLVRNAVDHGIEPSEERRRAGKPERGHVQVRVELRGTRVGVTVEDDGAGLDPAAVRAVAVERGIVTAEAAARLTELDAARLVFHSGFSTAAAVTEISGRGVGLDVVQDTAARLQGTVALAYQTGRWTRFDLDLPVSLSASAALLVRIGRDVAALPADTIARVLLLREADVGTVAGRATVKVGGEQLSYAPLRSLLGLAAPTGKASSRFQPALVLAVGGRRAVVGVEELLGQQELVVSSLGVRLGGVPHLAGAAVLDDGRVVGVLSAGELLRRVQPAGTSARAAGPERPRVLVADDSLTTRSAMKSLLEIAGYSVVVAGDGEEALQLLGTVGAQVVVSDVQMPRADGLELTRRIKADPRLRSTPVILVTSLDAPEERAAGLEAGADGYLVKREVERGRLLDMVRQLLPARGTA
jgi:two-component system, chemotaxis family, sensor kinase CheA